MKKPFLCLLLALSLTLFACTPADTGLHLMDTFPWTVEGSTCEETCSYRVIRYLGDNTSADTSIITTDDSQVVYTLKEGYTLDLSAANGGEVTDLCEVKNDQYTLLKMSLDVSYLDESFVPPQYRGVKNDTIVSYTVFNRYDMSAVFTFRRVLMTAAAEDSAVEMPASHLMWADYSGSFLGAKIARFTNLTNNKTKELSIKAGDYYDNEYIFYMFRSLKSVKTGGSQTISFSQPYEDYLDKSSKVSVRGIAHSTASSVANIPVGDEVDELSPDLYDMFVLDDESETPALPCLKTSLGLTSDKAGPALELYYSKGGTINNGLGTKKAQYEAQKVLVKILTRTFSSTTELAYTQVFMLKDYSSEKSLFV